MMVVEIVMIRIFDTFVGFFYFINSNKTKEEMRGDSIQMVMWKRDGD